MKLKITLISNENKELETRTLFSDKRYDLDQVVYELIESTYDKGLCRTCEGKKTIEEQTDFDEIITRACPACTSKTEDEIDNTI